MSRKIFSKVLLAIVAVGLALSPYLAQEPKHEPATDAQATRYLVFKNTTDRRLKLWIVHHVPAARGEGVWRPAAPEEGLEVPYKEILPGQTYEIAEDGARVGVDRVRFWAESESGWTWSDYYDKDFWLVEPTDEGDRHYHSPMIETYTYSFEPLQEAATMEERQVRVRNESGKLLIVNAEVLCHGADGKERWRKSAPVLLEPGKTVPLRDKHGWFLHGSHLKLYAGDNEDNIRWTKHQTQPMEMVGEEGYKALQVELLQVVLTLPGIAPPVDDEKLAFPSVRLAADQIKIPAVEGMTLQRAREKLESMGLKAKSPDDSTDEMAVTDQEPHPGWVAWSTEVRLYFEVVVPDLSDLDAKTVKEILEANGLLLKAKDGAEGTVKTQAPEANTRVKPGTEVAVTFQSAALGKVMVPSLIRRTLAEAAERLAEKGLKLKTEDMNARGKILLQDPPTGSLVERGSEVTAFVAPEEGALSKVPDLRGMSYDEALQTANGQDLIVRISKGSKSGKVQAQTPEPGAEVEPNSVIAIALSDEVEKVAVPDVIGMEYDDARAEIEAKGLVIRSLKAIEQGKIKGQLPEVGALVPRGSSVTVFVGETPADLIAVPDVVGMIFAEAKSELDMKLLVIRAVDGKREGKAISQDPQVGTLVKRDAVVSVAFLPETPPMPPEPLPPPIDPVPPVTPDPLPPVTPDPPPLPPEDPPIPPAPPIGPPIPPETPLPPEPPMPPLPPDTFLPPLPPDTILPPITPVDNNWVFVPNVIGQNFLTAKIQIELLGLTVLTQGDPTVGVVVMQVPPPATRVRPGMPVMIAFTGGVNDLIVPNVVGTPPFIARNRIANAGFTYQSVGQDVPGARVRSQIPMAGARAPRGSPVLVFYPEGNIVIVPNVVGMRRFEARVAVESRRLVYREFGDPTAATAMGQQPPAGSRVPEGTPVLVTFPQGVLRVPNVVGMTWGDAEIRLAQRALRMRMIGNPSSGRILAQRPVAGTPVLPGAVVEVIFPDAKVRVPDVTNVNVDTARARLEGIGLRFLPMGSREGVSVFQRPQAGTEVDRNSNVEVFFKPDRVDVPNVVGLSREAAQAALAKARLVMRVVGDASFGKIIRQVPAAGTKVFPGASVEVELRPHLVPVPNVLGLHRKEAEDRLARAGLSARLHGNFSTGTVASQSPLAGTPVPPKSIIDLNFPGGSILVPSVLHLRFVEGKSKIESVGLKIQGHGDSRFPIERQVPSPGATAERGQTVHVYFAAESTTTVPNLHGMELAQAQVASAKARVTLDPSGPTVGRVSWQAPSAGTAAPINSKVRVAFQAKFIVPNLVHLTYSGAYQAVHGKVQSHGSPQGGITKHEPPAGASVDIGSIVHVYFQDGMVTVPKVIGMSAIQAQATLIQNRLKILARGDMSRMASEQSPAPGTKVASGSLVSVHFGDQGPAQVAVPSVVGMGLNVARTSIERAGLVFVARGNAATGTAQSQTPTANQKVARGSQVIVVFPETVAQVKVPNVVGMTQSQADAALRNAKLNLLTQGNPQLGPAKGQNPVAFSTVKVGATIVVTFPTALMVQVPNLAGMTNQQANRLVSQAGLNYSTAAGHQPSDIVNTQTPAAGISVAKGTTVSVGFATVQLVRVPSVLGMTHGQAHETIQASRLISIDEGNTNTRVKSQNPAGGTMVRSNSTVRVTFEPSVPPPAKLTQVPNVVALTFAQARQTLESRGLHIQPGTAAASSKVLSQSPGAGTMVKAGSTVTVTLSQTPPPPPPPPVQLIAVPNVVKMGYASAKARLESAGLRVTASGGDLQRGLVVSQFPAANSQVKAGTTVNLTISAPPPPPTNPTKMVNVPNVAGMTYTDARSRLLSIGLQMNAQGNTATGRVTSQSPSAGAQVRAGSTVTVYLSATKGKK